MICLALAAPDAAAQRRVLRAPGLRERLLEAGERIVVEGVQRARPGMPVRIAVKPHCESKMCQYPEATLVMKERATLPNLRLAGMARLALIT